MSVNNNELLPCPFCGGKAKWKGYYTGSTSGLVECAECAACTRGVNWEEAKERWNTRAERTCMMERDEDGEWHCLECNTTLESWCDSWAPDYCPNCGAKVVER